MNDETLQERASIVLKPMNVFILISMVVVVFTTAIVLLFFYTPLKYYIPGYDNTGIMRQKIQQDMRIDSLERINRQYFEKWKAIDKIVEGNFEASDSTSGE